MGFYGQILIQGLNQLLYLNKVAAMPMVQPPKQVSTQDYNNLKMLFSHTEKDKESLAVSIKQLNECYTQKIAILGKTIEGYEERCEELLEWKKTYIEKQLFDTEQYANENQRLMAMIDELSVAFEHEKQDLNRQIADKQQTIEQLYEENEKLRRKHSESELKIEELVDGHIREIEALKLELRDLACSAGQENSGDCLVGEIETNQQEDNQQPDQPADQHPDDQQQSLEIDGSQALRQLNPTNNQELTGASEIKVKPMSTHIKIISNHTANPIRI